MNRGETPKLGVTEEINESTAHLIHGGLLVGALYGVIQVKSPAPPIVALLGLFGLVLGEQAGGRLLAKKIKASIAASAPLVEKRKDQLQRPHVQSAISAAQRRSLQ
jgi:XapX domain-containing protein